MERWLHGALTLSLAPLLLVQGRWVRRRTPLLPEPPGPRAGVIGQGPVLRLLIAVSYTHLTLPTNREV